MADVALTSNYVSPVNETQPVVRTGVAAVDLSASRGIAVYINSSGKLAKAIATAVATADVEGITTTLGAAGQAVEYMKMGSLEGFTLTALAYGLTLYLSTATAGVLQTVKPSASTQVVVEVAKIIPMSDSDLKKVLWVDCTKPRSLVAIP